MTRTAFVHLIFILTAVFFTQPSHGHAQVLKLELPLQCGFPVECYVQSNVDIDPGKAAIDYTCGVHTYDKHRGTDFRVRDLSAMDQGVAVVAAAAGRVTQMRDGVRDAHMRLVGRKVAYHRGAGNMVVIDHGKGWKTLYGHMRRNSIAVKVGDQVKAGQKLGLVGMSGLTEFPHLHFELNHKGRIIDPFTGSVPQKNCKLERRPLWTAKALAALEYRRNFVIASGFSDYPLNREALLYGIHISKKLDRKASNLVFNIDFAGLRIGDSYELRIFGPTGKVFVEKRATSKKNAAVRFDLVGRKIAKRPAWPTGIYTGELILYREEGNNRQIFLRHQESMRIE